MKHLMLDLVRACEAAALAASAWIGSGNKELADRDATDAMRERLNAIDFAGMVRIGEGKKDESFGLFDGERVGRAADGELYDLAVDPIDGTTPTVTSGPEAVSVIALGRENSMFYTEEHYMHKLAYGPAVAKRGGIDINEPLEVVLRKTAEVLGKPINQLMVCILNRPRHAHWIAEMRRLGVRIKLIQDCDISGAISTCRLDSGIDLCYGIGGAPEAVITAAAMKCLRGGLQACLADGKANVQSKVYQVEDLLRGECAFAACGVTDGSLLRGVRTTERGPMTHSVVVRSESGTVRFIETRHGN